MLDTSGIRADRIRSCALFTCVRLVYTVLGQLFGATDRYDDQYFVYGVELNIMQESLVSQGFGLLLYGLGTVFVFLTMLVAVVTCVSYVIVRFFPEPAEPLPNDSPRRSANNTTAVDPKTLKIIQAAIDQHRSKHHR